MTTGRRAFAAALLALALLTAACGGGDPNDEPSAGPSAAPSATDQTPSDPIAFTAGEAEVTVSGDIEETFTARLDQTESLFDPASGEHELLWTNGDGRALRLTIIAVGGQVQDAFVAIGAPGVSVDDEHYFPDAFHTQCTVTITAASVTAIGGQFTCEDLDSVGGEETIKVEGTFEASAA